MNLAELFKNKIRPKKDAKGFTLIEAMIFLFIFSVSAMAFYAAFVTATNYIIESKIRLMAAALANERMEIVRNLDYADIGTIGGSPSGNISQHETIVRSGRNFYIFTLVQYVDDPFDDSEQGTPDDEITTDYKRVRIKVAWEDDILSSKEVVAVSTFAPPKKEVPAGGGTLAVNVLDQTGSGISQVLVHITNPGESIDMEVVTDNTGNISFPGAPADDEQDYHIEISKDDYYSAQTYPPYPTSDFDPIDENVAMEEGELKAVSIITDQSADFTIRTENLFGTAMPSVDFTLKGGRKIGDTVPDPDPDNPQYDKFDFEDNFNSGSSGEEEFEDRSYGVYTFEGSVSGYTFIGLSSPYDNIDNFEMDPGEDSEIKAVFADNSINSLAVTVKTASEPASFISGATVRLQSESLSYDATDITDESGIAHFPESLPELEEGSYDLTVTAEGYDDFSATVNVDSLEKEIVSLSQT